MAGTVPLSIRHSKVVTGTSGETLSFLEGSSQTFKEGAPVIFSSGYVIVAGSGAVDTDTDIIGFAAEDAHNITQGTQQIRVYPALRNYVFEGTLENDSTNAGVLAQTDLGASYALNRDTTNDRWFVDKANTTKANCLILESPAAVGDTKPRVRFIIVSAGTILT